MTNVFTVEDGWDLMVRHLLEQSDLEEEGQLVPLNQLLIDDLGLTSFQLNDTRIAMGKELVEKFGWTADDDPQKEWEIPEPPTKEDVPLSPIGMFTRIWAEIQKKVDAENSVAA